MDDRLESRFGCSVSEYVEEFGMDSFRTEESELLTEIMTEPSSVIATNWRHSMCKRRNGMDMRKHGVVVYLSVSHTF